MGFLLGALDMGFAVGSDVGLDVGSGTGIPEGRLGGRVEKRVGGRVGGRVGFGGFVGWIDNFLAGSLPPRSPPPPPPPVAALTISFSKPRRRSSSNEGRLPRMYPFLFCALAHVTSTARAAKKGTTWFLIISKLGVTLRLVDCGRCTLLLSQTTPTFILLSRSSRPTI